MSTTTTTPPPAPAPVVKAPTVGQGVWFYADRAHAKGMKSVDDSQPFAAMVASAPSARVVNLLVVDHLGTTFTVQSVPLFYGDDKDDKTALSHCELEPPEPKETFTLAGVAGQPIELGLAANMKTSEDEGASLVGVKLIFIVPPGNTYTFANVDSGLSQVFMASPKPQTLIPTPAQIEADVLTGLTLTVAKPGDVLITVTATELLADGVIEPISFDEAITVGVAPPVVESATQPATASTMPPPAVVAAKPATMGAPPT